MDGDKFFFKNFPFFREKTKLQFRWEIYNLVIHIDIGGGQLLVVSRRRHSSQRALRPSDGGVITSHDVKLVAITVFLIFKQRNL
jgi:hypothetical protein